MATIGSFKKVGNDFQGEIITLSLQAKGVRIVAESNPSNDKGSEPHGIFVGRAEIGAAWSKRSEEGRDYLSTQARRSLLHGAILREPVRRRGWRRLHPAVVAAAQERRVTLAPKAASSGPPGGASLLTHVFRLTGPICAGCPLRAQRDLHHRVATRSAWLMPSALASSNNVTTVGLRRPRFEATDILLGKSQNSGGKAFLSKAFLLF